MKHLLLVLIAVCCLVACKSKKQEDKPAVVNTEEKKLSEAEEVTAAVSALLPAPNSYELKRAKKWHDASGENWLVLYETGSYIKKGSSGASAKLSAILYQKSDSGFVQKWKMVDYIEDCEVDVTCSFYDDHLTITDLDSNGLAEITMVYALSCKGDLSPNTKKLIMYEGAQKYAIRGEELMVLQKDTIGGQYSADSSFGKAPKVFLNYAVAHWQKFGKQEYQ
ncbi:MAG: M949_RS01915 family surface polysaccharide biosynthesis protein [Lacibacter sp.]